MPTSPAISVIMPCFNAGNYISTTINRVFQQSFTDFELIIINDGSSDNTLSILNELATIYPRLRVIDQPNQGAGPARNTGLAHAQSIFIAFLDADDSWHPDCLLKLHQKLQANSDAALAYCGWQNIGLEPQRSQPYIPPDYETTDKIETLLRGCPWPIHAALTRKSFISPIQGFNPVLSSCEDYDLWLRIASFNRVVLVSEVLAFYYHHPGDQITKNRLRIASDHWQIQLDFLNRHGDIAQMLGKQKIADITHGELLHRAYISYWQRDLITAYTLFRKVLFLGYFKFSDLKYLLLTILPFTSYRYLITRFGS